jgi:hypothetical protein
MVRRYEGAVLRAEAAAGLRKYFTASEWTLSLRAGLRTELRPSRNCRIA